MAIVHCSMIYLDTANSGRNKHLSPHDTTSIHNKHSYDLDKYHLYRSQQALIATDATFIHNEHLYQTDKLQLECTQHLYSANVHARQTGIGHKKTQHKYTAHIHMRQTSIDR